MKAIKVISLVMLFAMSILCEDVCAQQTEKVIVSTQFVSSNHYELPQNTIYDFVNNNYYETNVEIPYTIDFVSNDNDDTNVEKIYLSVSANIYGTDIENNTSFTTIQPVFEKIQVDTLKKENRKLIYARDTTENFQYYVIGNGIRKMGHIYKADTKEIYKTNYFDTKEKIHWNYQIPEDLYLHLLKITNNGIPCVYTTKY